MATIEPRLIHLLNEPSDLDEPQVFRPSQTRQPERPTSLNEENTHNRFSRVAAETSATSGTSLPSTQQLDAFLDETRRLELSHPNRTLGSQSLKALFEREGEHGESVASFSKPLDISLNIEDGSGSKRVRGLIVKDDLIQLPQPVKKQKLPPVAAPPVPPIINGLHEPPPDASIFPRMLSQSHSHQQIETFAFVPPTSGDGCQPAGPSHSKTDEQTGWKTRKRATRPRKKWTEDETKDLMLGVDRHGAGKWTNILEDPDFKFNGRSAGDLKDRFRTCCPIEYQQALEGTQPNSPVRSKTIDDFRLRKSSLSGHESDPDKSRNTNSPSSAQDTAEAADTQFKKKRAHRKNVEDLAGMGILVPFKKAQRRARCPFTAQDDEQILDGIRRHGPAWTKIQRDPLYNFHNRQPTDLRDRVRNKYLDIYQKLEKGGSMALETAGRKESKGTAPPTSVLPTINSPMNGPSGPKRAVLEPPMHRGDSNDDMVKWLPNPQEASDHGPPLPGFDLTENITPHLTGGEMDISRLLLEEPKQYPDYH